MNSSIRRVAITGAAGYVGRQLIRRLEQDDNVEHILATDILPMNGHFSSKVTFREHNITDPIAPLLSEHRVGAVAHLAYIMNPDRNGAAVRRVNVGGAANVLDACVRTGVQHLLYFSSTTVYGAHPDNPPELTEEAPMRPVRGFQYAENKAAVEVLLKDFMGRQTGTTVSVLRSCPVMGPNADNFIARTFSRSLLVGVKGYDPPMQFLHEEDMAEILSFCLLQKIPGLYNLGGHRGIRWSEMAESSGRRLVQLPAPLLYGLTGLTWNLRLQNDSPPCGLDFIRYRWLASTEKIQREQGIRIRHSSREAWEAFVNRPQEAHLSEAPRS